LDQIGRRNWNVDVFVGVGYSVALPEKIDSMDTSSDRTGYANARGSCEYVANVGASDSDCMLVDASVDIFH
jgi:hypothetical protein